MCFQIIAPKWDFTVIVYLAHWVIWPFNKVSEDISKDLASHKEQGDISFITIQTTNVLKQSDSESYSSDLYGAQL